MEKFNKTKSILIGIIIIFALSTITDFIFEKSGLIIEPFDKNPLWLIILVTVYRNIYNILGCYVCAKFTKDNPFKNALMLGYIGLVLSTGGCIAMWSVGPHWYPISLIITCMPCAYIGGKLRKGI